MFIESWHFKAESSPIFTTALALNELTRGVRASTTGTCNPRSFNWLPWSTSLLALSLLFISATMNEFTLRVILKWVVCGWLLANNTFFHVVETVFEGCVIEFISLRVQSIFDILVVFINWWMCKRVAAWDCTWVGNHKLCSKLISLYQTFNWRHCNLFQRLLSSDNLLTILLKLTHI